MAFQDGFISELVGRRATVNELPIGRVTDFLVNNPDQTFPEVDGLIIKTSQGPRFAPMDTVSDVDADGNRFNPNKLLLDPYALEISQDLAEFSRMCVLPL